jgi:hypothetical protein
MRAAIRYINDENIRTRSACSLFMDAVDLILRAEKQPEPGKGDLTLRVKFNEVSEHGLGIAKNGKLRYPFKFNSLPL